MKANKVENYSNSKTTKFADDALVQINGTLEIVFQACNDVSDLKLFRSKVISAVRQSYSGLRETKREELLEAREAQKAFVAAERLAAAKKREAYRTAKAVARRTRKVEKVEALRQKLADMEKEIGS